MIQLFETILGIGMVGSILTFALVVYLDPIDSSENRIADALCLGFLVVLAVGVIGTLLS